MVFAVRFLLMLVLSYLGLLAGTIISHFTKEELKDGLKYFLMLKFSVFAIISFVFFFHIIDSALISLFVTSIVTAIMMYVGKSLKNINPELFSYSFFSVCIYETRDSTFLIAALIFIYGIAVSSSISARIEEAGFFQKLSLALTNNIIYIVMGMLLSFI